MNKKLKRLLCLLLTLSFLLQAAPLQVFATNYDESPVISEDGTVLEGDGRAEDPYILGEIQEERTEYQKRFRLTDGSFSVAQFEVPVHYEDDGEWLEIDNTLHPVAMFNGTELYQASIGDRIQAFSATLTDGTVMSIADEDTSITMSLWDGTLAVETPVEDNLVIEESAVAEPIESEPPIEVPAPEESTQSEVSEPLSLQEESEDPLIELEANESSSLFEGSEQVAEIEEVEEVEEETEEVQEIPAITESEESEIAETEAAGLSTFNREAVAQVLNGGDATLMVAEAGETELRSMTDVMPDNIRSTVLYEDIYPNVDLQYDTFSYNVKESIILNAPASVADENSASRVNPYTYTFYLELDGLIPNQQNDGSILFLGEDNVVRYTIPSPYMFDAAGEYSQAVTYTVESEGTGYLLTVEADVAWLESEERVYPVTIDPTILSDQNSQNFLGTTSIQTGTNSAISSGEMGCGYHITNGNMKAYFKVPTLPTIDNGNTVVGANVQLNMLNFYTSGTSMLSVSQLTEALTDTEWSSGVSWSDQPAVNPSMDYVTITYNSSTGITSNPTTWDITQAMKEWYDDPTKNYGVVVESNRNSSNSTVNHWFHYSSSSCTLIVQYRNTTGIEDYYTYETHSVGRAGTVYVGDYSGNVTVVKEILSFPNTAIPYSLSMVYNSGYCSNHISNGLQAGLYAPDYSQMKTGYGWQLSAMESCKLTTIGDRKYIVYRDGDGTQHFCPSPNYDSIYKDEDGLGLTIVTESFTTDQGYTMTDQNGNTKYFRNGYLMYIEDGNGNRICFLYNGATYSATLSNWYPPSSGAYLSSIVSVNKGQTAGTTIASLSYSGGLLSSITDYAGRSTTFGFSDGLLGRITVPDGSSMQYRYSSGKITTVYDAETQHGLAFAHNNVGAWYITDFTAATCDGTRTVRQRIRREKKGTSETVYTYANDSDSYEDAGAVHVRYAFDYYGRTINAVTLNNDRSQTMGVSTATYTAGSGTTASNNRINREAQGSVASVNLLKTSGLENHDNFTTASSSWSKTRTPTDTSTCNAVVSSSGLTRNGSGSLKFYVSSSAASADKVIGLYQSVPLTAGKTYTFSAYINTTEMTSVDSGGGVFAAFTNTSGTVLARSPMVNVVTNSSLESGWQRVFATYTPSTTGTYRVAVYQQNAYGVSYADDLQLELGSAPSGANLVQEAHFENAETGIASPLTQWTSVHGNLFVYTATDDSSNQVGYLWGDVWNMRRATQTIPINKPASETYLLSACAYANSAAGTAVSLTSSTAENNTTNRFFGIIAKCLYSDSTYEYFYMPFNDDYRSWQYASCVIAPSTANQSKTLSSIKLILAYDRNINGVAFDNISLTQEPCTTYTYDSQGNITAVNATGNSASAFTYASGTTKLTKSVTQANGTYTYTYGDSNNDHLVTKIQNDGVTMNITYDAKGNSTATSLSADSNSSLGAIKTSATYSSDGSQLMTQTNSSGYKTTYGYDSWRNLSAVTDNAGNVVNQTYNNNNNRPNVTYMTGKISVQNSYENGNLSNVNRGGYIPNDSTKYAQNYVMAYDAFGNMTSFKVGTRTLASYAYNRYKTLATITYGNGDTISYTYDDLDRVTNISSSDGQNIQNYYSSDGKLSKILDKTTGKGIHYEYDSLGRLIHSYRTTGDGGSGAPTIVHWTEHLYDTENRIKTQKWHYGGVTYSETFSYDSSDGSLTGIDASYGDLSFTYDGLKRLSSRNSADYGMNYTYRNITSGSQTTNQVSKISYVTRNSSSFPAFSLAYTYNTLGNISKITGTTRTDQTASYAYDTLGQLTTETNTKGSYTYSYDTYGNIRSVSGTESHTYTYGNSEWRDLLTKYDGTTISYDTNGNPTSYYNGSSYTMAWKNGRQLSSVTTGGTTTTYTYDATGVRDSKTVGSTTYKFYTANGQVGRQSGNGKNWTFFYDNQGRPNALIYDNAVYYYVLNLQGDVIGLINTSGTYVAQYAYDAWGKVISSSGTLADINPLRYRGYYYDSETGFYYLGSRYYDPAIKRFINADEATVAVADNASLSDKNLFAYCDNNPVSRKDANGYVFDTVIDVGSVVFDVIDIVKNPSDPIAWVSLAADLVSLATPVLSGGGSVVRAITNSDEVIEATKQIGKVFDTTKQTRSSKVIGAAIHKAYNPISDGVKGMVNRSLSKYGSKLRPDAVDFDNRIIYELKPYNKRAYKQALRQTKRYAESMGGAWTIVIDMYKLR